MSLLALSSAQAATVQFQTVMGDFEVELFDETTPVTVANFLEYVEAGAYTNSIVHRSVNDFIIQGGGFTFDIENSQVESVQQRGPILNEPFLSNTRGTIAMAKLPDQPDSAVNQWFINLEDSNEFLDSVNGGFTVFGKVTDKGMEIIDAIADLKIADYRSLNSSFKELPLRGVTSADIRNKVPLSEDNLVLIKNIMILSASDTNLDDNAASSISSSLSSSSTSSTSSDFSDSSQSSSTSSDIAISSSSSSSVLVSSSSSTSPVSPIDFSNSSNSFSPDNSNGGGGSTSLLTLFLLSFAAIARGTRRHFRRQ
ncbi:peptidylprolyl isomerase [Gilvimarinus chinensis]|uniref:peptidylprolyl isomerase n=1 Tax=Gilvimarinus chinensis TaxID=396005 RepID=UPI0014614349|nr:peptidylprolyl isomerase [Gilvimarinus chinensis]